MRIFVRFLHSRDLPVTPSFVFLSEYAAAIDFHKILC
jgi:hypothetical protein